MMPTQETLESSSGDRLSVDVGQPTRIKLEEDRKQCPPWDGLADEQGPIPTFGPAQTDSQGRLIIDNQERDARCAAAVRALAAIRLITDESDTDEVWREGSVKFEGAN